MRLGGVPRRIGDQMAIKSLFKRFLIRGARLAASQAQQIGRDARNVDICLAAALQEPGALTKIRYPAAYLELLRSSIEPMTCSVVDVRREQGENDAATRRFETLLDVLRSDVLWQRPASESGRLLRKIPR
jgi:hypothetical protein